MLGPCPGSPCYPFFMTNLADLSDEQLGKLVKKIQDSLLKQARRNPRTIGLPKKNHEEKIIRRDDADFTCCGADMHYQDIFDVRRYYCPYRSHHPAIYVRQSDGEMLREEGL
jgi:hypothetical protein